MCECVCESERDGQRERARERDRERELSHTDYASTPRRFNCPAHPAHSVLVGRRYCVPSRGGDPSSAIHCRAMWHIARSLSLTHKPYIYIYNLYIYIYIYIYITWRIRQVRPTRSHRKKNTLPKKNTCGSVFSDPKVCFSDPKTRGATTRQGASAHVLKSLGCVDDVQDGGGGQGGHTHTGPVGDVFCHPGGPTRCHPTKPSNRKARSRIWTWLFHFQGESC